MVMRVNMLRVEVAAVMVIGNHATIRTSKENVMAKLRHIAMQVPDPAKAAEFYMHAFGMHKVGETDWENARGVYLSDGVVNLALLKYKTVEAAGEERGVDYVGIHHIRFWVDDVNKTRKAIEAQGGRYWK